MTDPMPGIPRQVTLPWFIPPAAYLQRLDDAMAPTDHELARDHSRCQGFWPECKGEAMPPTNKPVREDTARAGIGFVFGLCAFIAVVAFFPSAIALGALAGAAGAVLGWLTGGIPYHHANWFRY